MIDLIINIGDEVLITIPKENREWGYNPFPDGTKATVIGFSETYYGRINNYGRKPGVHVNRSWVKVRLPDGKEHTENSGRISLADSKEYSKRLREFRKFQAKNPDWARKEEFIRELPETPFWESDFVNVAGNLNSSKIFQITGIDYNNLSEKTSIGTKYPAYNYSDKLGGGWYSSISEDNLFLVRRGPVWKFYHNEPIVFRDIQEEANFFETLGHTREVRNPANGLYSWTKDEVLDGIKKGIVHGFSVSDGFLGTGPRVNARLFKNAELGRRVAKATLEGFGIVEGT